MRPLGAQEALAVGILKFAIGANYKRFYNNLKVIGKQEGKLAPVMFCDAALCAVTLGSGLADYLNYEFYKKPFAQRREYVTIRDQDEFYKRVSPAAYKDVFSVKPNFFRVFAKYTGRQCFVPEGKSPEELGEFLRANPVFVEKPVNGLGGQGVVKKEANEVDDPEGYLAYLAEKQKFLETYIVQHERMAALCPQSVNTIRVMTSSTSGTPKIIYCGLRVGNGKNAADNFHAGGMGIAVNAETGVLEGDGWDKDLHRYAVHPATGVKFDGYQLPCWDQVKAMVLEAAMVEPRIMVIGWDVSITPAGPIFVEGNRRPGFDMPQVTSQRGRKDIITAALHDLEEREKREGKK